MRLYSERRFAKEVVIDVIPLAIMMIENDSDRDFISGLFLKNERSMYLMAMKIVKEHNTACDMVSEACLKMIDKVGYLREIVSSKQTAYILAIVKNTSLSYLRRRRNENKWQVSDPAAAQDDVDAALICEAETEIIRQALSRLKPRYRELLEMKYFAGMSDEEIGRELDLSKGSVRYHLANARRALRNEICKGDDAYV